MRFVLGDYLFEPGEATLKGVSERRVANARGGVTKIVKTLGVSLELIPTGTTNPHGEIVTRFAAVRAALATFEGQSGPYVGWRDNSNQPSQWWLDGATSISGISIKSIDFDQIDRTAYVTHGSMSISFEAEYPPATDDDGIIAYAEEFSVQGDGGPEKAIVPVFTGPSKIFETTERTPIIVTQSGQAVGRYGYPLPNSPRWPSARIGRSTGYKTRSPEFLGQNFQNYPISWSYTFVFTDPVGIPVPTAL